MNERAPRSELQNQIQCYSIFLSTMSKNRLVILRHEFIHLAYAFYTNIIIELFTTKFKIKPKYSERLKKIGKEFEKKKKDFASISRYRENISYLFNLFWSNMGVEQWKKDSRVQKILKKKEIVLSPFAYESLSTLLEKSKFRQLKKFINEYQIIVRYKAESQKREPYLGQELYYKNQRLPNIEDINRNNYVTGMSRDFYNFINKLEEIFQKKQVQLQEKVTPGLRIHTKKSLFNPKVKFPIEKSSDTFLSNCPEYKNKYLVDFGKAYVNRRIIDEEYDPSIMRIGLGDLDYKVTVVELNLSMKVILLGYSSGKIKLILLYKVNLDGPKYKDLMNRIQNMILTRTIQKERTTNSKLEDWPMDLDLFQTRN